MKTKEIEVWVTDTFVDQVDSKHLSYIPTFAQPVEGTKCTKARLIIELPEKKITISESQFDELWNDLYERIPNSEALAIKYHSTKDKLFGTQGDG